MITASASTGFIVLEEKMDGQKLWQLKDSEFVKNAEYFLPGQGSLQFLYWHILAQNFSNPVVVKATYSIQIIMNECQLPCHPFFFASQRRSSL